MEQQNTRTASIIEELRAAQAAQATRADAIAASVAKNATDVESLTGLIQSQAATLAALGSAVARLYQSSLGVNTTLAALLEKVNALTDNQTQANAQQTAAPAAVSIPARTPVPKADDVAAAAAAAAATAVNARALQRLASPRVAADKSERSDDEAEAECDAQRARAAPTDHSQ